MKKSIAAIASRWLFRNSAQRFAGSGFLGALRIQRRTVLSERSKPSIFNSPWMRGAPQVLFSATMRKMSSRSSLLTHFLPAHVRCREIHFQYSLSRPDASELPPLAAPESALVAIWTRGDTKLSRTTYQRRRSEAADGAPSKRQVVAVVPGSPRADRGGNRRIEQPIRTGASAGAA
jgi:hypothetical protein